MDTSGRERPLLQLGSKIFKFSPTSTSMVATGLHLAIMFLMVCNSAIVLSSPSMPFPTSFHPSHQLRGAIATTSFAANGPVWYPSIASAIVASLSTPATHGFLPNSATSPLLFAIDDAATPLPAIPAASNRPVLTIPPPSRSLTAASPGPAELSFETTSVAPGLGSTTCFNGLTKLQLITSSIAQQQRAPSRTETTAAAAAAAASHRGGKSLVGPLEIRSDDSVVHGSFHRMRRGGRAAAAGTTEAAAVHRGGAQHTPWSDSGSGRGALGSERVPGYMAWCSD